MSRQSRSGFTLVELLVVVVLGGLIVLATYEVLITNTPNNRVCLRIKQHDIQTIRVTRKGINQHVLVLENLAVMQTRSLTRTCCAKSWPTTPPSWPLTPSCRDDWGSVRNA